MIYYKRRGLRLKLKRFFSNFEIKDVKSTKPVLFILFQSFFFLVFFILIGVYLSYLYLLPKYLDDSKVEAFLNNNLKNNSKLVLDIDNLSIKPDYKFNIILKADKLVLKYPNQKDFLNLNSPYFNLNLITLFQGYLDLNKIKAQKITINTNFTKQNNYSAFEYFNFDIFNFKFKNIQPKLRKINFSTQELVLNIYDENVNKTFVVNSNNTILSSNSFFNSSSINVIGAGSVKSTNHKLADYNLKVEILLKEFNPKIIQNALLKLNYNPFSIADDFKFFSKSDIDLKINLKTNKPDILGKIALVDFTCNYKNIKLPKNNFILIFKGDKILTDFDFKLLNNKFIKVKGVISPYKNKYIELKVNSNQINLDELNFILLPLAKIFNYNDDFNLQGLLLVDLYLKSDFKKIISNGKLEIKNAKFTNITQKITLNNINSNVNFNNNQINILNSSFKIGSEQFFLDGIIDSRSNLNLNVKSGMILASGFTNLIRALPFISNIVPSLDNYNIISGTLKLNAKVKGTLAKPLFSTNSGLNNLKVKLKNQNALLAIDEILITSQDGKNILLTAKNILADFVINSKKSTAKIQNAKISASISDIILDKTKIMVDNTPAILSFRIKNPTQNPETTFLITADNLVQNNIIKIKQDNAKFILSGLIKQNKLTILDCRLFNNKENLAVIKGAILNINSKNPIADIKLLVEKRLSILIPSFKGLSFDVTGNITLLAKGSNLDIFGDLKLYNVTYPSLKLKVNNLILNIKNKNNMYFNAQNVDLMGERLDATGFIKYQKNKFIVTSLELATGYFDFSKFQTNLLDNNLLKNIEIEKLVFNSALVDFNGLNLNNLYVLGTYKYPTLSLKQIKANLYHGSISGGADYNLVNSKIKSDLILRDINVRLLSNVIKEIAPLSFAASGNLGAVLSVEFYQGAIVDILKSLDGYIKFTIKDGELSQLAKLERFLQAGNILSQSILKLSLNSILSTVTKQNTGDFKLIEGSIIVKNAIAEIKYLKTQGTNMSLFATGRFNLLTEISNIRVLGRVPSSIVSVMGRIGNFTTQKLVDKLSDETKDVINSLSASPIEKMLSTTLPETELNKIPPLVNGENKQTRNFIVIISGDLQSTSSIKNFKWHLAK